MLTSGWRRTATVVAEQRHWLLASARLPEAAALGRGEEWWRQGDSRGDGGDQLATEAGRQQRQATVVASDGYGLWRPGQAGDGSSRGKAQRLCGEEAQAALGKKQEREWGSGWRHRLVRLWWRHGGVWRDVPRNAAARGCGAADRVRGGAWQVSSARRPRRYGLAQAR
ncbi:hypothetical protein E2562_015556 [Oryza meyeriana var. granulata]|uniref:DUF834 domain-containing protein n=1 Tax=Oryza meyeriana var. granulata TaxID=110450 RepID=A0A6G1CGK8_9ORYZ|nr:hypothetical protein E2562_015556 [Oryza meyeriana var. granulata]